MGGFRGCEGPGASLSVEEEVSETWKGEKSKGQQNAADKWSLTGGGVLGERNGPTFLRATDICWGVPMHRVLHEA